MYSFLYNYVYATIVYIKKVQMYNWMHKFTQISIK